MQATAKTSQIFLGMAVQCTQCHNHPFNEYKQNQFWELNAFFRQTKVEQRGDSDGKKQKRFAAKIGRHGFQGRGRTTRTRPRFITSCGTGSCRWRIRCLWMGRRWPRLCRTKGEDFGDSGDLEEVNRREELAKLIVESRDFDQAIANRMWGHFLGYGFTKPVDDIGPHNPPSHPELLEELGQVVPRRGFDLKQLMRWIVLREAYGLSSQMRRGTRTTTGAGREADVQPVLLRQMEAEQLYESLLVATAADERLKEDRRDEMKEQWLKQFNTAFGTDDNDESTTFNGSIPQALMMMNGELVKRATATSRGACWRRWRGYEDATTRRRFATCTWPGCRAMPTKQEMNDQQRAAGGAAGERGARAAGCLVGGAE